MLIAYRRQLVFYIPSTKCIIHYYFLAIAKVFGLLTLRPASKSKFQMQSWVVVGEMESPKSAKQSLYGTKKNAQIS